MGSEVVMLGSRRVVFLAAAVTFGASGVASACSPGGGSPNPGDGFGPGGAPGTGAGSAAGGSGAVPPDPGIGGSLIVINGHGGGTAGPDGSCAVTTARAERVVVTKEVPVTTTVTEKAPVALYLMQDQSGSMLLPPTKWTSVQTAVQAFTTDPQAAGLDIALQFFRLANNNACDGTGYDVPEIAIGPLPQNATAINNAYAAHFPITDTPIEPALRGAVNFCLQFQATNTTGEQCVAVLITDGAPSTCLLDPAGLAQIAADAHSKNVLTFAIGMDGADFATLDAIAKAGGTDCTPGSPGNESCNVASGGSSFIDALNLIRKTVSHDVTTTKTVTEVHTSELACEFQIPPAPAGQSFDPTNVNVNFRHDGTDDTVLQVPTSADCAKTSNQGWYYDKPTSPTSIQVCSGTCDAIKASTADGGATTVAPPEFQVVLGCATQVATIH